MEGILRQPDLSEVKECFSRSFDWKGQVVYYPVRHHSPACAWHLRETVRAYQPEVILIEGPSDSAGLLPFIADNQSESPFCIYYSYDDKDGKVSEEREKYRAYYPFLSYSPELVAIREAATRQIPVRFIDMPYALRLLNSIPKEEAGTQYLYNEDREYEENCYTRMLAERAKLRSFSEFWDAYFELPAQAKETRAFVRDVFSLGYFMRLATPEDSFALKEDRQRERYMAEEIRQALPDYARILVVTGAFHVAGLMEALEKPEKQRWATPAKDSVATYLMPYTFREADSRSGYAAGIPFPAYYQSIWERMQKPEKGKKKADFFDAALLDYVIKTGRYARKTLSLSVPDEINAYQMAHSLARLRGKPQPGVYELLDAVRSCFVKGDIHSSSTFEIDFLLKLLSGMGAGRVVANDCIPPVVKEFRALCAQYRLKTSTVERQEVTLDIVKNPQHYKKSCFLHQLLFLETGFATLQSGPDYVNQKDKNRVREIWICRYGTPVETRLIDLSVYGSTLSQLCSALIERDFRDNLTAENLGKLLLSVQVMGIPDFYKLYEDRIVEVVEREKNFVDLCRLLGNLRYLSFMQQLMDGELQPLIPALQRKVLALVLSLFPSIKNATADEEQEICEQIRNVYQWLQEGGLATERKDFLQAIRDLRKDTFCNSRVYGLALGISYKEGELEMDNYGSPSGNESTAQPNEGWSVFSAQLQSYLQTCIQHPEQAASFVCGLFLVSRDVLFLDGRILETLDQIIASVGEEEFLGILPNLRYAFTSFFPLELERLGQMIAERHGLAESFLFGSVQCSQEEIVQAMQLDSRVAGLMKEWRI